MSVFKNKTVVITGAGGVLCGSFSLAIARLGANVALLDIDYEAARAVQDRLVASGYSARAYSADVLDKQSLIAAKKQINNDFGLCDMLINGAGGNSANASTANEYYNNSPNDTSGTIPDFFHLSKDGVNKVFDLNFMGTFLPCQVFCMDMTNRQGCSVVNISSMSAYSPMTKVPAYSAAKAAISNFTMWLAVHLSKCGIRVNALAPGFFRTKQNESLLFNKDGTPSQRTSKILAATPLARLGKPEELDEAVLFLLDETKASFITGIILPVDGGFLAYSGV